MMSSLPKFSWQWHGGTSAGPPGSRTSIGCSRKFGNAGGTVSTRGVVDGRAFARSAGATRMSSFRVQRVGWERLSAPFRLHALQVAEDGARVHPEVLGGLGPVAAVPLQHLVDVTLLPLVARLRERRSEERRVGKEGRSRGAAEHEK